MPGITVPNGKVLLLIGATQAGPDRAITGILHPGLSNQQLLFDDFVLNTAGDRSGEVWGYLFDGDGSTGDLTITWDGSQYSQGVVMFDLTQTGAYLGYGLGTAIDNAANLQVTYSNANGNDGVTFGHYRNSSSGNGSLTGWSDNLIVMGDGGQWHTLSATAAGTTGALQTYAADAGTIVVGLAVELLFAYRPPVAADDSAVTQQGSAVNIDVLANDTDPENGTLSVDSVTQGTNGSVSTDGATVTYTPNAGWSGTDTFTYTCISSVSSLTDTATVTVTVNPSSSGLAALMGG
ncbi:MAG TPA: hypothetical protein ENI87_10175 [bacterium]|nr:hypothetical protein [bacterium]